MSDVIEIAPGIALEPIKQPLYDGRKIKPMGWKPWYKRTPASWLRNWWRRFAEWGWIERRERRRGVRLSVGWAVYDAFAAFQWSLPPEPECPWCHGTGERDQGCFGRGRLPCTCIGGDRWIEWLGEQTMAYAGPYGAKRGTVDTSGKV